MIYKIIWNFDMHTVTNTHKNLITHYTNLTYFFYTVNLFRFKYMIIYLMRPRCKACFDGRRPQLIFNTFII